MARLKKVQHAEQSDGQAQGTGAKPRQKGSKKGAKVPRVYRFKILRSKMPARRFIIAERSSRNPLSSLARALRISK